MGKLTVKPVTPVYLKGSVIPFSSCCWSSNSSIRQKSFKVFVAGLPWQPIDRASLYLVRPASSQFGRRGRDHESTNSHCNHFGFLKAIPASFTSFQQLTVNLFIVKVRRLTGLETQTLVLEATALSTEPQPLPVINLTVKAFWKKSRLYQMLNIDWTARQILTYIE